MSLDLNGEAVNNPAELAPQPDVPAFGADVVDEVGCVPELAEPELPLDLCTTQTSFVPTLVHFSVVLPDLAVRPDFAHLPPGVFAAFTSKADNPRSVAATVRTIETLTTLG
jgi:hypothetical protein